MAILIYFEQGGLEKSKVVHLAHQGKHCIVLLAYTLINRPLWIDDTQLT